MKATILVLPGDGIGPEVTAAATKVLTAVAGSFGHTFTLKEAPIGGAALRAGLRPLPDATLSMARDADAILLGAVGDPQFDRSESSRRPETALLAIRILSNSRPELREKLRQYHVMMAESVKNETLS